MQPLQQALATAHENIFRAQEKQKRLYAQCQLHGKPEDTGKGVMQLPAPSVEETPAAVTAPPAAVTAPPAAAIASPAASAANVGPSTSAAASAMATPVEETAAITLAGSKRTSQVHTILQARDFVLVRIHSRRSSGKAQGKLAAKIGPYYLAGFTDASRNVAIIEDSGGQT